MAEFMAVNAARWVVGKALSPLSEGLVEAWTASSELGRNVDALKMELLYVKAMLLSNARGRQLDNPGLTELLQMLRDLAYDAEDVLDELDYFRIQDELDGTYEAADEHAKGCLDGLALNARHTARSVGSRLKFSSSPDCQEDDPARRGCAWPCGGRKAHDMVSSPDATNQGGEEMSGGKSKHASSVRNTVKAVGKHLPCYSSTLVQDDDDAGMLSSPMPRNGRQLLCGAWPCKAPQSKRAVQTPKLKFDRVQISARMKDIIEQLKPVCAKVSTVLNLELPGSSCSTAPDIAKSRPITTQGSLEPTLYGRDTTKKNIIYDITKGKYCDRGLTVLPIVGPGGIGKTTLTQHIYKEVEDHFDVKIWVCVSLNFDVNSLTEKIEKLIPKLDNEEKGNSDKLIEQRLKHKKFMLVLDDMWNCDNEDEWKRLLVPFRKEQKKGSIILVTTRFPALAETVKTSDCPIISLEGLGPDEFWSLFLACMFGDEQSGKDHGDLLETGREIVKKLKGDPLAAKTVGRLLRNRLDLDHWTRVLESKEWELQSGEHNIMPALKLSYDYLSFHLQQCFTYCALFPEDYKFEREELIHLWIGLDILHSYGQNKRIEDTGRSYLDDLVDHGFFLKLGGKEDRSPCYVIHDLLHELAVKVSSHECLSIYSSNVRSIQIPPSIRHLSIIIDDTDVKDRTAFENHKEDLSTLDKRLKVENLHSLMLFGEYHGSFARIFANLFRDAKALRIILLSGASYNVEELLHNFSKLIHLRYLRIKSVFYCEEILPSTISRFYHLRVLDLKEYNGLRDLPRDMSNLVKMRHFLVRDEKLHSDISEVGKVKYLQELRRFGVKKDINGFELRQLGHLVEIGGSLHICNLENVQVKEAVDEAKLEHKNRLHELILEWDINRSNKDPTQEERVLESLKPHSNLREVSIRGHGGTTCPTWLGVNFSTKSLESLCLDDIAWNKLPTLGEMWVVNEHGEEFQGCITGQSFQNLKRLELIKIPRLKKWVENNTCHLLSRLEVLIIKNCSELMELPFSNSTCNQPEQEANINGFHSLRELNIVDCPKLLSVPPIPWKSGPCSANIARVGLGFEQLAYSEYYGSGFRLEIKGDGGWDSVSWKMLIELKMLVMNKCPPLPLDHLQMLTSLKVLEISDSSNVFLPVEGEDHVGCPLPVEEIEIERCAASGKELTQWLSHFPKLTELRIYNCQKITGLGVVEQQEIRGGDETAAEGLLLLPPQIQELGILNSPELSLRAHTLDDDTAGGTGGGGLQRLRSLRSLYIVGCPKFLSSSSGFPFPTSLQELCLNGVEGMATLAPLSNLTSLTELVIVNCGDLRGEDLWPRLTQGHLIELVVNKTPKFFIGSEPSKLQKLATDDVAGVLAAPVCGILSSSLTSLVFIWNQEERFTEEQEKALHLLTSLQDLQFWHCDKLQCLPAGLHRLTNLKKLEISKCPAIRSLAKDVLPSSLQELQIWSCPAIRSLPKDGLPSSLRVLDVHDSHSSLQVKRNHSNNPSLTNPRALLQFVHSPSLEQFSVSMHSFELPAMKISTCIPILYIKLVIFGKPEFQDSSAISIFSPAMFLGSDEIMWCTCEDLKCQAEITSDDWTCFQKGSYSSYCCQLGCAFLLCVLVYYFPRIRMRIMCHPIN